MVQYGFFYDAARCTGCKTCEAACRDYHHLDDKISYRHVYEIEDGSWTKASNDSWITDSYTYYTAFTCCHCDNPVCTQVCPTKAMNKDENGLVSVDTHRCIGCGYCELSCPYGNPHVDRSKGHSVKCDGCADRVAKGKVPICVEACSMRAIEFGLVDQMAKKGERAAVAPLPEPSVTLPNFYIKNCEHAQPSGSSSCRVNNAMEVQKWETD